jgi:PQQ-dependent catabolism-associated CXXCW motif protein
MIKSYLTMITAPSTSSRLWRKAGFLAAISSAVVLPATGHADARTGVAATIQVTQAASVEETAGYRMGTYRAPVPATLAGGTVVSTDQARALVEAGEVVLIDVQLRPRKPKNLTAGTIWRLRLRNNIPGSAWLANTGAGVLAEPMERYFRDNLARLSQGDKARAMLFYCQANCWMSWNAAKRAISYGYSRVYWYPEGTDGWIAAGLPTETSEPVPLPDGL